MAKRQTVDMCDGPLLRNILLYALPLMASGLLQLLYNAADMIVVARFAGGTALAAVGSNGPLVNLIVNVFVGLSVGASVLISRYYGAKDEKNLSESVHTAMGISVACGIFTMLVGVLVSEYALGLMSTPYDVIDQATIYLRIYFLGMPGLMVYNFGSAILRAVGDTKRPLYILFGSGIINVLLNLVLVIGLKMDVAGVAIATTVSQYVSAICVVVCLMKTTDSYRFEIRKMRIYKDKLVFMLRHGIPAGIQGSIFSLSNIIIQSSVNSFGSAVMSGNSAAANVEGFVFVAMNSMHHTCLAFSSQNIGAGRNERLPKIFRACMVIVTVTGLVLGWAMYFLGDQLLVLYTADSSVVSTVSPEQIIYYGKLRLGVISTSYFICGIMDVLVGALRGMGSSLVPMLVSIGGVCGVRILWIFTVFKFIYHSPESLYLSYTVSWIITAVIQYICYRKVRKKYLG